MTAEMISEALGQAVSTKAAPQNVADSKIISQLCSEVLDLSAGSQEEISPSE